MAFIHNHTSQDCDIDRLDGSRRYSQRGAIKAGGGLTKGWVMAKSGRGYFDRKGHFFKTPRDATVSDLAGLLGQIGDGESLAPGIAHMLFERRAEIEALFAEHDEMMADAADEVVTPIKATVAKIKDAKMKDRPAS